jgi:soluble lytic murein transglycosylase-like protein
MRAHEFILEKQQNPQLAAQLGALKRQAEQQRAAGNEAGARASERAMAQISTPAPASAPVPGADNNLLAAVKDVESGGRADAVSRAGAVGSMQTMPKTLKDPGYGVRPAADASPAELERVGRDYFSALMKMYRGDAETAAIAYNMGPGATDRWIAAGSDIAKLPRETQAYVPKILNKWFDLAGFGTAKRPVQVAAAPVKRV